MVASSLDSSITDSVKLDGLSSQLTLPEAAHLKLRSREASYLSVIVAVGAVARIGLGELALEAPTSLYGILIKVGLTETLAFVSGFVFGSVMGFLTGALIIVISDLFMLPGPWTPFIAGIIGVFGAGAGVLRRFPRNPNTALLVTATVVLTLLSEFLQNAWVALFFNIPLATTMVTGIPSMVTAVANNVILITTVGWRVIKLIQSMLR
jgi:uncharacterized membrane protein